MAKKLTSKICPKFLFDVAVLYNLTASSQVVFQKFSLSLTNIMSFNFIVIGGGVAGVTCTETVNCCKQH